MKEETMNYETGGQVVQSGRSSFARVYLKAPDGETYVGVGFAVRDDHDSADDVTGFELAAGRALCELGSRLKRAGWDRVHQQERVRRATDEFIREQARKTFENAVRMLEYSTPRPATAGLMVGPVKRRGFLGRIADWLAGA